MKLVKIISKPAQKIIGIENAENLTLNENVLVSDAKYRLLDFNHVKMVVMKEFTETAVADITGMNMNKAYVIKELIDPVNFDSFDPAAYEIGDYVLVYKAGPVFTEKKPVMRKPLPGYTFTPVDWTAAVQEYNTAIEAYNTALAAFKEEETEFINTVASLPAYGYLVEVVSETHYKVVADLSYETTKTVEQFNVWGKLPFDMPTLTTIDCGGIPAGTSIKGMTLADILTTAFGLEFEEDVVGNTVEADPCEHDWSNKDGVCTLCEKKCKHDWSNKDGVCKICEMVCTHNYVNGVCTICKAKDPDYVDPSACTHDWSNKDGVCTLCGAKCTHDWSNKDGVCKICEMVCTHDWNSSTGKCKVCGIECTHNFVDGTCTICGMKKPYAALYGYRDSSKIGTIEGEDDEGNITLNQDYVNDKVVTFTDIGLSKITADDGSVEFTYTLNDQVNFGAGVPNQYFIAVPSALDELTEIMTTDNENVISDYLTAKVTIDGVEYNVYYTGVNVGLADGGYTLTFRN